MQSKRSQYNSQGPVAAAVGCAPRLWDAYHGLEWCKVLQSGGPSPRVCMSITVLTGRSPCAGVRTKARCTAGRWCIFPEEQSTRNILRPPFHIPSPFPHRHRHHHHTFFRPLLISTSPFLASRSPSPIAVDSFLFDLYGFEETRIYSIRHSLSISFHFIQHSLSLTHTLSVYNHNLTLDPISQNIHPHPKKKDTTPFPKDTHLASRSSRSEITIINRRHLPTANTRATSQPPFSHSPSANLQKPANKETANISITF